MLLPVTPDGMRVSPCKAGLLTRGLSLLSAFPQWHLESRYRSQSRGRLRIRCLHRSTLPHSRSNPRDLRRMGIPCIPTRPQARAMVKTESGSFVWNATHGPFQPGIRAIAFLRNSPKTRASANVPSLLSLYNRANRTRSSISCGPRSPNR